MRDKVADPKFLLLQKVERRINYLYPESYFPLYSMVSFTDIEYQTALSKGNEQESMIQGLIRQHQLNEESSEEMIDLVIHSFMKNNV
jgi:kynurenine 3-monooxygenase